MLEYLPLAVGSVLLVGLACVPLSDTVERLMRRLAIGLFGSLARSRQRVNQGHVRSLRAAHVSRPYAAYASVTYLYTSVALVIGSVFGLYLGVAALLLLDVAAARLSTTVPIAASFSPVELFAVVALAGVGVGLLAGVSAYQYRWYLPQYRAGERERFIDNTLQRNIAFMFALSRSGMGFTKILRILSGNQHVYGETAAEFGVTVRDIDLFGADVISALRRTGRRTPSEELQEFVENLTSVLQSGQSVSVFLRNEYDQYKEEAESDQQRFLELLSTLAEGYVTVFVAGPLFLITILVVIGLVSGGTLDFLRAFTYLILPLATLGFVVYLDTITSDTQGGNGEQEATVRYDYVTRTPDEVSTAADGGVAARAIESDGVTTAARNRARLRAYNALAPIRYALTHPIETITERPVWLLALTAPLAVLSIAVRWGLTLAERDLSLLALVRPAALETLLPMFDDAVVQALLFLIGTFAVVWEIRKRRLEAVERAVPDFLDRLASTNEAGMPIVASIERVARGDLGGLNEEVDRTWTDVRWGAPVEAALKRFETRVRTPMITRVVTLTTNAMSATSDLAPVLRIAADEAQSTQRLKRERRNELVTYLVVIYLAFFVFIAIIVALDTIFVPAIPTADQFAGPAGQSLGSIGQLTEEKKAAYSLLFFHTALVQAVCSGFVAGQMSETDIRSGAKHAFIMLVIAYGVFLFSA
ncbi:type II secretion system F family protein [Halarchaeum nitratireducens]|uniref:Type II secretion protein F n=1 Tax=Halarchaeum nitratireducens TaxID=489913 RepID=A0A830GBA5_9EURY|nr:type II secretion system F family protein [Halarchaeum nitratireducens]GGN17278.1 type II secretion protein F [Halarchaeum nitratireducens]